MSLAARSVARSATSGSSPRSRRRSPSSTSTRCGPTRTRCWSGPGGKPIRVASKSIRCRALIERDPRPRRALRRADDLHAAGDPVAGRAGLRGPAARLPDRRLRARCGELALRSAANPARAPIVMVDCVEHLDAIESVLGADAAPVRVCIDIDAELVGARRAGQGRAEALAGPHGRAGGGAGAGDRTPAADRTRRADGLRGADRRGRRRTARAAPARRRDPLHADAARPPSWPSGARRSSPRSASSASCRSSTAAAPAASR